MYIVTFMIIILSSILFVWHWYQTRSRYAKLLNAFPGPPVPLFLGNVLGYSTNQEILFKQIRQQIHTYKETWRAWITFFGNINIVTADDAEIILSNSKHSDKGELYMLFEPWLSEGLLTSSGPKWQHRRKILTPAFHFNILKNFVEIFEEHSKELVEKLKEECATPKSINIVPLITCMTLGSICETSMGIKLNSENDSFRTYFKSIHRVAEYLIHRAFSPWFYPMLTYYLSPQYWRFRKLINFLHEFTTNLIRTREENFNVTDVENLEERSDELDIGLKNKRLAMLDLLLYHKTKTGEIDDNGIREEVDTFVFEGHDTTSVSAGFTLMLLAKHQDIQKQIIKELDKIFKGSSRHATYDDLQNMKYLERCIKESLRLYPSVPVISRKIVEDTQLTHHLIPANTTLFIHIYNVHRDPNVFPDPEKFDPDRFLLENTTGRNNYAYIPFSAGPRNCIGQKYAMFELKSLISSVLRNFTMEPVDNLEDLSWIIDLVLRIRGPLNIRFVRRDL